MLKKARLLTRPTLARRDAPFPKQGRNFEADPRFTFHGPWERSENAAGGLFQHPARARSILLPGRQLAFVPAPFLSPSSHTPSQSL